MTATEKPEVSSDYGNMERMAVYIIVRIYLGRDGRIQNEEEMQSILRRYGSAERRTFLPSSRSQGCEWF